MRGSRVKSKQSYTGNAVGWISAFERVHIFGCVRPHDAGLVTRRPTGSYQVSGGPTR